ncbi:MAG TPA: PspC domain-containing protein [Propionibacterium sp.]|jgi:phage shock protein PspC (stress-responsive transcriptional regulator)|nr:PspC domain-containing protein [Propionibacterium sp.]
MASHALVLQRPRDDRLVAGVCAGIARRMGVDPRWVRVAFAASMLLPGPQLLLYLIAWGLIPSE